MKITYFVHGTTYDNKAGKCSGWKQVELNELGQEQAQKLGEINSKAKFDIVFTSDLIRAIDTAKIAFPKSTKIQDQRLRECNYGKYDGKDKKFVNYEKHINIPFEDGESLKDVIKRVKEFIEYVKENYSDKNIAIVSHRAPQLAFDVLTKKISMEEAIKNDWRKTGDWQPGWEYII